jgi:hypothetical protein
MPIPSPEPGLVISYAYLWHREHQAGQDEGSKSRPSVIVLAVERSEDGATAVTVLPITHSAPLESASGIEIPAAVKRHLGLDGDRSWVIVSEGNEFLWPGYDLHKRPHTDRYDYGFLPPRFFDRVLDAFVTFHQASKRRLAPRD